MTDAPQTTKDFLVEFNVPEHLRASLGYVRKVPVLATYKLNPATLEMTWPDGSKTIGGRFAERSSHD